MGKWRGLFVTPCCVLAKLPAAPSFFGSGSVPHTQKKPTSSIFLWAFTYSRHARCARTLKCRTGDPYADWTNWSNAISYSSSPVWHLITHTCTHSPSLNADERCFFFFFCVCVCVCVCVCEPHLSRRPAKPIVWLPNSLTQTHTHTHTHKQTSAQLDTDICTQVCLSENSSLFIKGAHYSETFQHNKEHPNATIFQKLKPHENIEPKQNTLIKWEMRKYNITTSFSHSQLSRIFYFFSFFCDKLLFGERWAL